MSNGVSACGRQIFPDGVEKRRDVTAEETLDRLVEWMHFCILKTLFQCRNALQNDVHRGRNGHERISELKGRRRG